MLRRTTIYRYFLIVLCIIVNALILHTKAYPEIVSKFSTYRFKQNISIDIPNSWEVIKSEVMEQIDTATESITGTPQGNNLILIAANCYTKHNKPSATVRLSIRNTKTATQDDIKNMDEFSLNIYSEISKKSLIDSLNKIQFQGILNNYKTEKIKIGNFYSLKTHYTVTTSEEEVNNILHIINLGTKRIKLYLTYRNDEQYLEAIVKHIENSLQIR